MTESDWVEMYGMAWSAQLANSGVLITLMSGYLVVAYVVGQRLTRTQIILTNALYLISALFFVASAFQTNLDTQLARKMMALQIPELNFLSYADVNIFLWPSIITIVYSCLVFASLFFMWHVRNSSET
jgi:hypothetical protein